MITSKTSLKEYREHLQHKLLVNPENRDIVADLKQTEKMTSEGWVTLRWSLLHKRRRAAETFVQRFWDELTAPRRRR